MRALFRPLPLLLALGLALPGCAVDKTARSGTYLVQQKIDANRERARNLESDLLVERRRVDEMEARAASARKLLADSGATLETFLSELQQLRGEVAELRHTLRQHRGYTDDLDMRLSGMEMTLQHVMTELDVSPPPMVLPPPPPVEEPAVEREEEASAETERASAAADPGEAAAWTREVEAAVPTDGSGEDADFRDVLLVVRSGDWERAGGSVQRFLDGHPDGRWALQAKFLLARSLFELARYKPAITEFQRVIEADEASPWAARAMYMQGLSFEKLGTAQDLDAARVFYSELIRLYPAAPEAEQARGRLEAVDGQ